MIRNYITVTARNLLRYKAYSFINIFGLSIGLALCMAVFLFVEDEFSYDSFHQNSAEIYRLVLEFKNASTEIPMASTSIPVGRMFSEEFPEINHFLTFTRGGAVLISSAPDRSFYAEQLFFADEKLFEFFDIAFVRGTVESALSGPNTVILTESEADRYFSGDNPVGKSLKFNQEDEYTVTAVIEDPPENTHFQYGIIAYRDFANVESVGMSHQWFDSSAFTYFKLQTGIDIGGLETKIDELAAERASEILKLLGATVEYRLQHITDIHLKSSLGNEHSRNSDIRISYVFTSIAFFILIIACINFMNLATARSAKRAREVGLRKVLGAKKGQLIRQFIGESMIMSFIAFIISLGILYLILPEFNDLIEKDLSVNGLFESAYALFILPIVLLVGIVAGSYPAVFLSAFLPVETLKGKLRKSSTGNVIRKGLVVFQFAVSILLIISTIVMRDQFDFMIEKDLGFDADQLMVIQLRNSSLQSQYNILKDRLTSEPGVISVAGSSTTPGTNSASGNVFVPEGYPEDDKQVYMYNEVDIDFIKTYGMEILNGRDFNAELDVEGTRNMVVNESLTKDLGWNEPIGKKLFQSADSTVVWTIVGVVKDFHHFSADQEINPFVLRINEESLRSVSVRLSAENISETIAKVEAAWKEFAPGYPFEYSFTDENFESNYREIQQVRTLIGYLSFFAIFIACLGLFGLASYTAEQRTKEIGIRKVMGASVSGIVMLLFWEFSRWIIAANIIAWPGAYFLVNWWLQEFAYKIELSWIVFAFSGVLTLIIAVATMSYQSIKAATANPVNSIKYE